MNVGAIDLFCGAGGLTRGLEIEGIDVRAGIDLDPACRYPYEANNWGAFVHADVMRLSKRALSSYWKDSDIRLLAGCAPCQPFSNYTQAISDADDNRWQLLSAFGSLVAKTKPELITMENVAELPRHRVYGHFVKKLLKLGYQVCESIVDCDAYGIPQKRRRLVLLASRLGPISLLSPQAFRSKPKTVRDAIGKLPPIAHGTTDASDPLHRCSALSDINLRRIRASRPGGSWADWSRELVAACHVRSKGRGYRSVYGRMEWDKPAPTITTQSFGFGSGRFGHPEQDRALSLREAALLQTFPMDYAFAPPTAQIQMKTLGRLIGNAVPVQLGRVVGRTLLNHVEQTRASNRKRNVSCLNAPRSCR